MFQAMLETDPGNQGVIVTKPLVGEQTWLVTKTQDGVKVGALVRHPNGIQEVRNEVTYRTKDVQRFATWGRWGTKATEWFVPGGSVAAFKQFNKVQDTTATQNG